MTNFPGASALSYIPGLSPYTNPFMAALAEGKRSQQQQRGALAAQQKAQDEATSLAQRQMQANADALRRANAKGPNLGDLLTGAQDAAKGGIGSTLLTGPAGVDPDKLKLGRTSLLGS